MVAYRRRVFSYTQTTPSQAAKHGCLLVGSAAVRELEFFFYQKVHARRDLFALVGELNPGPGDCPPKLKKGAGTAFR